MNKILMFVMAMAITVTTLVGGTSLAAPNKMLRVYVNGTAIEDSAYVAKIEKAIESNLGKSIIVVERDESTKELRKCDDPHSVTVPNITVTKLGEMFRILVNGNVVEDSQVPSKIMMHVLKLIEDHFGAVIKIIPREALLQKEEDSLHTIVALAKKGKVVGGKGVAIGATRATVIQKWGDSTEECVGNMPNTTELMSLANGLGAVYSHADEKVLQVYSSVISDQFEQIFSNEFLVKTLGEPHKITAVSEDALERFAKEAGRDSAKGFAFLPVYTYKAGTNYIHFMVTESTLDEGNYLQRVYTVVDANCECLREL